MILPEYSHYKMPSSFYSQLIFTTAGLQQEEGQHRKIYCLAHMNYEYIIIKSLSRINVSINKLNYPMNYYQATNNQTEAINQNKT